MEVVGCDGTPLDKAERKEAFAAALGSFRGPRPAIDRVIVAIEDRRGELPLRELLKLRFDGVVIEEAGDAAGEAYREAVSGWSSSEQLYL